MSDENERTLLPGKKDGYDLLTKDRSWEAVCAEIDGRLAADTGTSRDPAVRLGFEDLVTPADRIRGVGHSKASDE